MLNKSFLLKNILIVAGLLLLICIPIGRKYSIDPISYNVIKYNFSGAIDMTDNSDHIFQIILGKKYTNKLDINRPAFSGKDDCYVQYSITNFPKIHALDTNFPLSVEVEMKNFQLTNAVSKWSVDIRFPNKSDFFKYELFDIDGNKEVVHKEFVIKEWNQFLTQKRFE